MVNCAGFLWRNVPIEIYWTVVVICRRCRHFSRQHFKQRNMADQHGCSWSVCADPFQHLSHKNFWSSWSGWPTKSESSTLKTYMFYNFSTFWKLETASTYIWTPSTRHHCWRPRIIGNVPQSARRLKASPRNRERQMDALVAANISVLLSPLIDSPPSELFDVFVCFSCFFHIDLQ